jgi:hypothetical protein
MRIPGLAHCRARDKTIAELIKTLNIHCRGPDAGAPGRSRL